MTHQLKTWPGEWEATARGDKTHEVRVNDRDFKAGDWLILCEWRPDTEQFTGRSILRLVSYVTPAGAWGLPNNVCILSIKEK